MNYLFFYHYFSIAYLIAGGNSIIYLVTGGSAFTALQLRAEGKFT